MIVVDTNILAAVLWQSEFRNVVALYLRKNLIEFAEALRIVEKAELQMSNQQFQVNSVQVLHNVSQSNCSSYDCEFISLAIDLDLHFVTLDQQLLQEFSGITKHPKKITNEER